MAEEINVVACAKCGAKNRVRAAQIKQAICGNCKADLSESVKPLTITDANFSAQVEQSGLPVLLDLWAEWCPPCRMLAPIIDQVAQDLAGKVRVGKLDVDRNPQTAARFQARSIPTILILKNGTEVDRLVGLQSKEAILQRLSRFI